MQSYCGMRGGRYKMQNVVMQDACRNAGIPKRYERGMGAT